MPALTTITVEDRKSTPQSYTYTPQDHSNGVAVFAKSDGVPFGDQKITMSSTRTANGNYKVRVRMIDPVVVTEDVNGVDSPKVDRTAYANLEFTFAGTSSMQERRDLIGKLADLLAADQTAVMAVCQDLESWY